MDMIPPEFRPFVGVLFLAVVFVLVASLIHKYRLWQEEKMSRVQRLLTGAHHLEQALKALEGLPTPQELGDFYRDEVAARYRAVKALLPRFHGIDERIAGAELQHPGRGGTWEAPRVENGKQMDRHTAGLSAFLALLGSEPLQSGLDAGASRALRERIRTLRAEARYLYVERFALESAGAGDWSKAQNELLRLMAFLKSKAPPNERGKALFHQAMDLYRHLNHRQLPGQDAAGDKPQARVA